jgi:acyl carrier protein
MSMERSDNASNNRGSDDWGLFVGHLAEVADVAPDAIERETRLVDDLNLDSLGLTEAVVVLLADLEFEELPEPLVSADWSRLTVGDVYDQCHAVARGRKVRFAIE